MKRITELLEKGCTMLASHHDCGAPLFRCKGDIVCPVCSSSFAKPDNEPVGETEAVFRDAGEIRAPSRIRAGGKVALSLSSVEPLKAPDQEPQEDDRRDQGHPDLELERLAQNSGQASRDSEFEIARQSVRVAVIFKLKDLALDIKGEKDLSRLKSQLDCVDAALRVISALK